MLRLEMSSQQEKPAIDDEITIDDEEKEDAQAITTVTKAAAPKKEKKKKISKSLKTTLTSIQKLEDNTKKKRKNQESSSDDDEDSAYDFKLHLSASEEEGDKDENEIDSDEHDLENIVFGSEGFNLVSNIEKRNKNAKKAVQESPDENNNKRPEQIADHFNTRKPAWVDDGDNEIINLNQYSQFSSVVRNFSKTGNKKKEITSAEIEESLKARYTKYFGTPLWADLDAVEKKRAKKKRKQEKRELNSDLEDEGDSSDNEDDDEQIFQQTGNFLSKSQPTSLPKSILDIKPCTDANKEETNKGHIKCVEFHPSARVMLTAGLNQTLSLFQIDGKKNAKIQTIFIEKFPILAAHFTKINGDEIILGSRHASFYYYDMIAGKIVNVNPPIKALDEFKRSSISTNFQISPDNRFIAFVGSQGQIHLFSVKSKEWIDTLKINDSCNAVTFSSDSRYLFAFGGDKDVQIFDMNDRGHRSFHKFADFGCLEGTSIAVSNNSQFIATGCKSGVVNLYNLSDTLVSKSPKPLKSFMNLTTSCTSLKFNSSGEILAAISSHAENACKLIHTGSLSVFTNFPVRKELSSSSVSGQIRIPECIDFSLNSGYFTIGNQKGNALLYRLKHYGSF